MKDHANAAQKLCAMEERLSAVPWRQSAMKEVAILGDK